MRDLVNEDLTVTISGEVARAVQSYYGKDNYSLMVEKFFKQMLPTKKESRVSKLSAQLRGCAATSGLVEKSDKEIRAMMYYEKHGI